MHGHSWTQRRDLWRKSTELGPWKTALAMKEEGWRPWEGSRVQEGNADIGDSMAFLVQPSLLKQEVLATAGNLLALAPKSSP